MMFRCTHPRWGWPLLALILPVIVGCGQLRPGRTNESTSAGLLDSGEAPKVSSRQAADVQVALGRTLEQTDRLNEAEQMYRDALKKDPHRGDAHARLAILCDRKADFKEASKHFNEAIRLNPKDPEIHCDQGYSFYVQRRWSESETSLRKALKLDPHHARSHNNLGLLMARQGDSKGALAEFARAGCDASDAQANLALVLAMEGHISDSQSAYAQAVALKPTSKVAREGLQASKAASNQPSTGAPESPTAIASAPALRDNRLQRTAIETKRSAKR